MALSIRLTIGVEMDVFRKIEQAMKFIIPKNIWKVLSRLKYSLNIIRDITFSALNIKYEARPRQEYYPELRKIISFSIRHISGPKEIKASDDELIVLCKVRNGQYFIASFIEHYFALGAKHIVFLDNKSDHFFLPQ